MTARKATFQSWKPVFRDWAAALVAIITWAAAVVFSVASYLKMGWNPGQDAEIISFAIAFALSSALAFLASALVYGGWRRFSSLFVLMLLVVSLGTGVVGSLLSSRTRMSPWAIYRSLLPDIIVGSGCAGVSGLFGLLATCGCAWMSRRRMSWRFRLSLAISTAATTYWGIPWLMSMATDFVEEWEPFGYHQMTAFFGAGPGAAVGTIAGMILAAIVLQWPFPVNRPASSLGLEASQN